MTNTGQHDTAGHHDGSKIRELRKEAGYPTASAFARQLGISPQSLINIERGKKPASLAMLIRIARELDSSVDSLLKVAA